MRVGDVVIYVLLGIIFVIVLAGVLSAYRHDAKVMEGTSNIIYSHVVVEGKQCILAESGIPLGNNYAIALTCDWSK